MIKSICDILESNEFLAGLLRRFLAIFALSFSSACSGPGIELLKHPVGTDQSVRALTSADTLVAKNQQTLKDEGLLRLYESDPSAAIQALGERHVSQPSEARRQALAEMRSDAAERLSEKLPEEAISRCFAAALLTNGHTGENHAQAGKSIDEQLNYHATIRLVRIFHDNPHLETRPVKVSGGNETYELKIARRKEFVRPSEFDLLLLADRLKFRGMSFEHVEQEGPVVADCGMWLLHVVFPMMSSAVLGLKMDRIRTPWHGGTMSNPARSPSLSPVSR